MSKMRKTGIRLVEFFSVFAILSIVVYLIGSFVNAGFNITEWGELSREILSWIVGFILIIYVMVFQMEDV